MLSSGAATTISYVQGNSATPQTAQSTVIVPFTAAQNPGDLNVVVVGWNDSTAVVSAVTDTKGNTYARAVGPTVQSGTASQSIYYAKNIAAAGAGANAVKVTFATAAVSADIRVLEYAGVDPNNPVDVVVAGSGNSATSSSGAATTTNATDLLVSANLVQTATTGPGSGFTERLLTTSDGDIAEDQTVTAKGSYSATAPLSSAGPWIMQMVAFRAASSGGTVAPTVTSVSPNSGSTAGGTAVTITRTKFSAAGAAVATFGGKTATNVVVVSGTQISATTPAGSAGAVTVTVTNSGALSGNLANGFSYVSVSTTPTALTCTPTSLGQNASSTCTVTLNQAAASGGSAVVLSRSNATLTVPASVTVAAGSSSATFAATTGAFSTSQSSTITATLNSVSQTASISLSAPATPTALTCGPSTLGPNATSTCTVSLNNAAPAGGSSVTLASNNSALGVPTSVTVAAGASSGTFTAKTGTLISANQSATITAKLNGVSQSATVNLIVAATISYVQGNSATPQTAQSMVSVPFTAAQSAGDLNVVVVGWNDSTAVVSAVTDTKGNPYTRAVGPTVQSGTASQSIYYAKNITAAGAGANTVMQVTFATAAVSADIWILEYAGADPSNPVDVDGSQFGQQRYQQ